MKKYLIFIIVFINSTHTMDYDVNFIEELSEEQEKILCDMISDNSIMNMITTEAPHEQCAHDTIQQLTELNNNAAMISVPRQWLIKLEAEYRQLRQCYQLYCRANNVNAKFLFNQAIKLVSIDNIRSNDVVGCLIEGCAEKFDKRELKSHIMRKHIIQLNTPLLQKIEEQPLQCWLPNCTYSFVKKKDARNVITRHLVDKHFSTFVSSDINNLCEVFQSQRTQYACPIIGCQTVICAKDALHCIKTHIGMVHVIAHNKDLQSRIESCPNTCWEEDCSVKFSRVNIQGKKQQIKQHWVSTHCKLSDAMIAALNNKIKLNQHMDQ